MANRNQKHQKMPATTSNAPHTLDSYPQPFPPSFSSPIASQFSILTTPMSIDESDVMTEPSQDCTSLISFGFEVKLLAAVIPIPKDTCTSYTSDHPRQRTCLSGTHAPADSPADVAAANRDLLAQGGQRGYIRDWTPQTPQTLQPPQPIFLRHAWAGGEPIVSSQTNEASKRTSFFNRNRQTEVTLSVEEGCLGNIDGSDGPVSTVRNTDAAQDPSLQTSTYRAIAETISSVPGQSATSLFDLQSLGVRDTEFWKTGWIIKKANSAVIGPGEQSGLETQYPGLCWVPIEVTSPVLRHDNDGQVWPVVAAVMKKLTREHIVVANYTCDVHVHLGRVDGRAFCLPTLKRLAVILWLAEDALRSVRDPRSPNFENVYTWGAPVTRFSRAARNMPLPAAPIDIDGVVMADSSTPGSSPVSATPATHNLDVRRILKMSTIYASADTTKSLRRILSATTHRELGMLLSGPEKQYRRLGMNFSAFGMEDERARTNPRTVEIRVLEGTLDSGIIVDWLKVLAGLVRVAVDEDGEETTTFMDFVVELLKAAAAGKKGEIVLRDIKMYLGVIG